MRARATFGLAMVAMAVVSIGCRDFRATAGDRIIDDHVLAGRADPALSDAELRAGRFESLDAHLAPLQRDLRQVGAHLGVKSSMWPSASGTVERFDPTDPTIFASGPVSDTFGLGAPFINPMNVADLEVELGALCAHPLLAGRIPATACQGFGLERLNDLPFDDYTITLDSDEVEVFWDGPRTFVDTRRPTDAPGDCHENDAGELRGFCENSFSCPTDDSGAWVEGTCEWNHPCTTDEDCRDNPDIDPGVCNVGSGTCGLFSDLDEVRSDRDRHAPVLVVRAPFDGDFDPNDLIGTLIQVGISDLVFDIRFQPVACSGAGCRTDGLLLFEGYRSAAPSDLVESTTGLDIHVRSELIDRSVSIQPGIACFSPVPIPPEAIALFPPLGAAGGGVLNIAACITAGEILRGTINQALDDLSPVPGRILDGFMNIPNLSVSLPGFGGLDISAIQAGPELRSLGGTGGAWTTDTMRVLAEGGGLMRTSLDLSSLNAECRGCPTNGSSLCLACNTWCGGPEGYPTCDLSSAGICLEAPDGSWDHCTDTDVRLERVIFDLALDTLVTPPPDRTEKNRLWNMITTPFPASPLASEVFDGSLGIGIALQRLFTQPLDAVDTLGRYRFTDTLWCGADAAPGCTSADTGALFLFLADADRDGVPDDQDNCDDVPNPGLDNQDGDPYGDACDLCPWTPDLYNNPQNCTCDIDGDGCVNPLGLPPIPEAPDDVPRSCEPGPGEVYDERPTRRSGNSDEDDDGILSDCDPDNDGDGVPDTEDNCPDDENADQRDQNDNGIGDVCDLCSAGQPICYVDPGLISFDPNVIAFDPGWDFDRGCVDDGPGCLDFVVSRCLQSDPKLGCFDFGFDLFTEGGPVYFAASQFGASLLSLGLTPDLTQDGSAEVAFTTGLGLGEGAELVVVDAVAGVPLWSYNDATGGFGTALAVDPGLGLIAVGAPVFSAAQLLSAPLDGVDAAAEGPGGAVFLFDFKGELQDIVFGEPGSRLGRALTFIGDGRLIASAPGYPEGGALQLIDLNQRRIVGTLPGKSVGLQLSYSPVAAHGNTLLVGVPEGDGFNGVVLIAEIGDTGEIKLTDLVMADPKVLGGDASLAFFGAALAHAGDFDGDGHYRFPIGAPGAYGGGGTVLLYDPVTRSLEPIGAYGYGTSGMGSSLASVGDRDGDGFDDLLVGFPGASLDGTEGAHLLLHGMGLQGRAPTRSPWQQLWEQLPALFDSLWQRILSALPWSPDAPS